jgi:hypothetical protein
MNYKNLISKLRNLVEADVKKNTIRSQIYSFLNRLKGQHDFLLYINPQHSSITVDPILVNSF